MLEIYNLCNKKEYISEVGTLIYEEWSSKRHPDGLQKAIDRVSHSVTSDTIPQTFIALEENILIGFVSLWIQDGEENLNLTPWLATLYVKPEYRGQGISIKLINRITMRAKELEYKRIYLKTNLLNFYDKYNWIYIKTLSNGEKLYYYDLSN